MALFELLWDSTDTACYSPPGWHIRELEKRVADAEKKTKAKDALAQVGRNNARLQH
jgi:hypothetical protein